MKNDIYIVEISIFIALILTIIILLFVCIRQHRTFRDKEKFHETRMQQTERAFAAERRAFIEKEEKLRGAFYEKEKILYKTSPPELFPDNPYWKALSFWLRSEKQWCCEKCGINLVERQQDLHVHHIFGKAYNSPQHLKVLCIACHAEQLGHEFMKAYPEYRAFLNWRSANLPP